MKNAFFILTLSVSAGQSYAQTLVCAPTSIIENVKLESRENHGYFRLSSNECTQLVFNDTSKWESIINVSFANVPSGRYVVDIYYYYRGSFGKYAEKLSRDRMGWGYPMGGSNGGAQWVSERAVVRSWNEDNMYPGFPGPTSTSSKLIRPWLNGYPERSGLVTPPYRNAPSLHRDYKGSELFPYEYPLPNGRYVPVEIPSGGGDSDIEKEKISYDVDSIEMDWKNPNELTFSNMDGNFYHERRAYTYYGDYDKKIRSIARMVLWVRSSDIRSHCEKLKSQKDAELRVKRTVSDGLELLKAHAKLQNQSLVAALQNYFQESQHSLQKVIQTLEAHQEEMGEQAIILKEYLEALLYLKQYPELSAWRVDTIVKDTPGFIAAVNIEKNKKIISVSHARTLLTTLPNLKADSDRTQEDMKSFDGRLNHFVMQQSQSDIKLAQINTDYQRLKNWMSRASTLRSNYIFKECAFE